MIADKARAPAHAREALLIPEKTRDDAVIALQTALAAVRRYWDKAAKEWIEEPDYATRLKAAELILAYAEGRPVERQVRLTGDFSSYSERLEKLLSTPEGVRIATTLGLVESSEKALKPPTIGQQTGADSVEQRLSKAVSSNQNAGQVVDVEDVDSTKPPTHGK